MRIKISKKNLKQALSGFSKIIYKKPKVQSESYIRIESTESELNLSVFNFQEQLSYVIDNSQVNTTGTLLVSYKDLRNFLNNTKAKEIEFQSLKDNKVELKDAENPNSVVQNFQTLSDEEFPELIKFSSEGKKISSEVLRNIQRAIPSAGGEEKNRIINGVLLEPEGVVATDAVELVKLFCNTGLNEKVSIKLSKFLSSGKMIENSIKISQGKWYDRRFVLIRSYNWKYAVEEIDGTYPKYHDIVPKDCPYSIELEESQIKYLQENVPLLESETSYKSVHIYADSESLLLLPETLSGSLIKLNGKFTSQDIKKSPQIITLKRDILLRFLKLGFNKLLFQSNSGVVKACKNDSDSFFIFMPIKNSPENTEVEKAIKNLKVLTPYQEKSNNKIPTQINKGEEKMEKNKKTVKKDFQITENKNGNVDFDEIIEEVASLKTKAKEIMEKSTKLNTKLKELKRYEKSKEKDFKNAKELINRLQKVSSF